MTQSLSFFWFLSPHRWMLARKEKRKFYVSFKVRITSLKQTLRNLVADETEILLDLNVEKKLLIGVTLLFHCVGRCQSHDARTLLAPILKVPRLCFHWGRKSESHLWGNINNLCFSYRMICWMCQMNLSSVKFSLSTVFGLKIMWYPAEKSSILKHSFENKLNFFAYGPDAELCQ